MHVSAQVHTVTATIAWPLQRARANAVVAELVLGANKTAVAAIVDVKPDVHAAAVAHLLIGASTTAIAAVAAVRGVANVVAISTMV